jgi:hypothetical protein
MFQISEVQESPAFNGRRSFLTLRAGEQVVIASPLPAYCTKKNANVNFRRFASCRCLSDSTLKYTGTNSLSSSSHTLLGILLSLKMAALINHSAVRRFENQ